ncbi:antitermination protein [Escherichia coli]|nr:antitermination protein [Escherichia coli]
MGLPPTTPPKLTDRRIKMDAQTRRRERRAEKQAQWKAANPLLVGVSAKPVNRPILSLNRKPKSRVESALNPIDLTVLAEYHEQIESNLQRIERKNQRKNQRTWYSKPRSEMGMTCVGRQKMKLGSKPLI